MNSPTLDSFESALLAELRQHVTEKPVVHHEVRRPTRHRVRRLAVGAVAAGLAASVVGVVGIGGHGGPSSAYAVQLDGDGDVVVTVHRLDDAAGLEEALRAKGIDADVSYDADGPAGVVGIGPDGQPMSEDELPPPPPPDGTGEPGQGTSQQGGGEGPVRALPADPGFLADDPCGFDVDSPPADLSRDGDDWVLRIPADSPLMDRHVQIGTDAHGGLTVGYAGDEPGSFCGVAQASAPR